jgi:hypothetical protein
VNQRSIPPGDGRGETFALTPPSADEDGLPGVAEWKAQQRRKAEAERLRAQLATFTERK